MYRSEKKKEEAEEEEKEAKKGSVPKSNPKIHAITPPPKRPEKKLPLISPCMAKTTCSKASDRTSQGLQKISTLQLLRHSGPSVLVSRSGFVWSRSLGWRLLRSICCLARVEGSSVLPSWARLRRIRCRRSRCVLCRFLDRGPIHSMKLL